MEEKKTKQKKNIWSFLLQLYYSLLGEHEEQSRGSNGHNISLSIHSQTSLHFQLNSQHECPVAMNTSIWKEKILLKPHDRLSKKIKNNQLQT